MLQKEQPTAASKLEEAPQQSSFPMGCKVLVVVFAKLTRMLSHTAPICQPGTHTS